MIKIAKKVLLLLGLVLASWLIYVFRDPVSKVIKSSLTTVEYVEEIKYGEVYTFSQKGKQPAYIKFIDADNYVAVPRVKSPEDSFEDADTYDIIFIEGKYSLVEDKYLLAEKVHSTTLSFDNEENLNSNKYTEMYESNEPSAIDFKTGSVKEREGAWVYRRNSNNGYVEYPLERSKKNLPNSTEEFLKNYKKADEVSSPSE